MELMEKRSEVEVRDGDGGRRTSFQKWKFHPNIFSAAKHLVS
jgi:hypothetical protein